MREIIINNHPVSDYLYEFTIVMPKADNTYDFIWEGTNGFRAEEIAYQHKGSVILHNVRISGKEKKKRLDKIACKWYHLIIKGRRFKMRNQINNYQSYADQYKYIVVRRVNGELWFWGAWNDCNRANEVAIEIGGEVVTNQ